MEGKCTHREYYSQFVNEKVISMVYRNIGVTAIRESKNLYMNDIPLQRWDDMVKGIPTQIVHKLKETGGWLSLGTGVCILKEAAKQIKEGDSQ